MLWLLCAALAAAAPLKCPNLICAATQSTACVLPSETSVESFKCPDEFECQLPFTSVRVSRCLEGFECPVQRLESFKSASCEPIKNRTITEDYCPAQVAIDFPCNHTHHCEFGSYCSKSTTDSANTTNSTNSTSAVCRKWKRKGQNCNYTEQCRHGTVCENGRCADMWSVPAGEKASSMLACESGNRTNGVCEKESYTVGSLPKQCQSDSDCTSSIGLPGKCKCALNTAGAAYCQPHYSDFPRKDFLQAIREDKFDLALGNFFRLRYYAETVGSEECETEFLLGRRSLANAEEISDMCGGVVLALVVWMHWVAA